MYMYVPPEGKILVFKLYSRRTMLNANLWVWGLAPRKIFMNQTVYNTPSIGIPATSGVEEVWHGCPDL